jgi:hypothetical protein
MHNPGRSRPRNEDGMKMKLRSIPEHHIDPATVKVGDVFEIGNGWKVEILRSDADGGTLMYTPSGDDSKKEIQK